MAQILLWNINVYLRLTHWGMDKMASILQTIYLNAYTWMVLFLLLTKTSLNSVPRVRQLAGSPTGGIDPENGLVPNRLQAIT